MSFENKNFMVVKKLRLPLEELKTSCTITADGEIAKVFALSFNSYVDAQEVTAGALSISGHIDSCMIYSLSDGQIESAFASCPFSGRLDVPQAKAQDIAQVSVKVIDHSIDNVSGNEAVISILLEVDATIVQNIDVRTIDSVDPDVCQKKEEITIVRFLGQSSTTALESGTYSSREKVRKVLGSESSVIVKSVETAEGFVSVSGDVSTKVLFVDENDRFDTVEIFDSFKEEIAIDSVNKDSLAEAIAQVNSSSVKIEVEDEDKGSKITVQVPFVINAFAYEEVPIMITCDVYSTTCDLEKSAETFNMTRTRAMENIEGKVSGSLTIDQDSPRVDKIIFTFGTSCQVTGTTLSEGERTIEGLAKATVVYLNDETSSLSAVELEVPFAISDKTKSLDSSMIVTTALLTDVDISVKKGRGIFFDGKIKAVCCVSDDEIGAVLSSAREGEEYPERDYAMSLIFAKAGDTLWDVAKSGRVTEAMVIEQNPDVIFPLEEDCDIVLFYQSKM